MVRLALLDVSVLVSFILIPDWCCYMQDEKPVNIPEILEATEDSYESSNISVSTVTVGTNTSDYEVCYRVLKSELIRNENLYYYLCTF